MKNHIRTMKIYRWIILFIGIVIGLATFHPRLLLTEKAYAGNLQTSKPLVPTGTDEAAIRAVYQQKIDGWNKGSGTDFAAAFAEDADLVGFDGTHLKGHKQIASFHQGLFDKFLNGSRLQAEIKAVQFLTPETAVIHAVSETIIPGQTKTSPGPDSIQTLVFTKRDGQWRIAAFQNTMVISANKAMEMLVNMKQQRG